MSGCIFCQVARSSTSLLHSDERVVAFQDINPSAFSRFGQRKNSANPNFYILLVELQTTAQELPHYLVIPVEHIPTVKNLQRRTEDFSLVSHMLNVGQDLVHRDAPNAKHYRFGFHQPPFNSVDHLHLHCFALPYIPGWKRVKYMSLGSLGGFIEAEKLLQRINPLSAFKSNI